MSFDVPEIITSDPQRLKQVLSNLVGNAVKFTEKGYVILKASIESNNQDLVLSIIDTGIGIDINDRDKIFDSFAQADGSSTRKFGGTGLGLSIVRQLSELLGGHVELDSETSGGSVFKVIIPLAEIKPEVEFVNELPKLNFTRNYIYLGNDRLQSSIFKTFSDQLNQSYRWLSEPDYILFVPGEEDYIFLIDLEIFKAVRASRFWARISKHKIYILVYQHNLQAFDALDNEAGKKLSKILLPLRFKNFVEISQGEVDSSLSDNQQLDVASATATQEPTILVVEDNEVNQRVIMIMLKKLGYQAVLAENGKIALDILSSNKHIELVIMDCQMPVMDGYTASSEIRKDTNRYRPELKIIAMTGNALEGAEQKCLDAGMDDYISKPIRLSSLKASLQKWQ